MFVKALTGDGWTVTDDPLRLYYGGRNVYVDPGAVYVLTQVMAQVKSLTIHCSGRAIAAA